MLKKNYSNFEKKSLVSFFVGIWFILLSALSIPGARFFFNKEVSITVFYSILLMGLMINIVGIILGLLSLRSTKSKKLSIIGIVLNILSPIAVMSFYLLLYIILVLIW